MRILLDTHVLLWWLLDDDALDPETKTTIDTEAEVFISAASVWELAIKASLGKLTVPPDLESVLEGSGLRELPVRARHAIEAGALPLLHRDPFDRLLVAQARCETLTLFTRDAHVAKYDVALRFV